MISVECLCSIYKRQKLMQHTITAAFATAEVTFAQVKLIS